MELFDKHEYSKLGARQPLAGRMRPKNIDEFVGQAHLVGEGRFLAAVLKKGDLPSLILWGPPGTGKTTIARIMAEASGAEFVEFSAVLSGVKEIREVVKEAKENLKSGRKTVLFVDEIHRFNKAQQDAFLHSVEDGTITLIGATTENPSFEVNGPLLSRCKVLVLEGLSPESIKKILDRALEDTERGLGGLKHRVDEGVVEFIADGSHGDARAALNCLETAFMIAGTDGSGMRHVTMDVAVEAMQKKALLYDKSGEEHYNVISAFIKSMRGSDPDSALYWLARMVEAGEDPLFIARRMVIFASEDIGNADPRALSVALSIKEAVDFVGMPEGWIPLAHGVAYLATAPKSNASYTAYLDALEDVKKYGALPAPLHIRNAPTRLMKDLGYSKGYKYPHDFKGAVVDQDYRPREIKDRSYREIKDRSYYRPSERGYEKEIRERMEKGKK
ncbi:MAG: replication-associated recombination protein A [Deltaproteobacteria bacterium]|nr:replication-associated recombination protein A [Deltaproteobacteria bacterium]